MQDFEINSSGLEDEVKAFSEDVLIKKIKENFGSQVEDFLAIMKHWKENKKVIVEMIKITNPLLVIHFMSDSLKEDREVVYALLKKEPSYLEDLPKKWREDKKTILKVMKKNVLTLRFASKDLQDDKELLVKLRDNAKNMIGYELYRGWCDERMETLAILEEEELMKKDVSLLKLQKRKVRKF